MEKEVNLIFSGGGLLGIAYVGAIKALEEKGYKYNKFAGTSAGSIIAALLAAGYKEWELKSIMMTQNFNELLLKHQVQNIPFKIGEIIALLRYKGLYKTKLLEQWIEKLLLEKNIKTFADLKNEDGEYSLKIYGSDITNEIPVVFPDDLKKYGINADDFSVAKAVTISCTIPYFFAPYKLNGTLFLDGGLIGSYPIWAFDKETDEQTVGFYFDEDKERISNLNFLKFSSKIIKTAISRDEYLFNNANYKSIGIPTFDINSTNFNINNKSKIKLYESGYAVCKKNL